MRALLLVALLSGACAGPTPAPPTATYTDAAAGAGAAPPPAPACAALTGQRADGRTMHLPDAKQLAARPRGRPCGASIQAGRVVSVAPLLVELAREKGDPGIYRARDEVLAAPSASFGTRVLARFAMDDDTRLDQPGSGGPEIVAPVPDAPVPGDGVLIKYARDPRLPLYVYNDRTVSYGVVRSLRLDEAELEQLLRLFATVRFDGLPDAPDLQGWNGTGITLTCARLQEVALPRPELRPLVDVLEALVRRAEQQTVTRVVARRRGPVRLLAWPAPISLATLDRERADPRHRPRTQPLPAALLTLMPDVGPAYFREGKSIYRVYRAEIERYDLLKVERCHDGGDAKESPGSHECVFWPARSRLDLAAAVGWDGTLVDAAELTRMGSFYPQLPQSTFLYRGYEYDHVRAHVLDGGVPLHVQLDTRPDASESDRQVMSRAFALALTQSRAAALATLSAACAKLPSCAGECAAEHAAYGRGGVSIDEAFATCARIAWAGEYRFRRHNIEACLTDVFVRCSLSDEGTQWLRTIFAEGGVLHSPPPPDSTTCR